MPKSNDPIVASLPVEQVQHSLTSMQNAMQNTAQKMPTHEQFLMKYGAAIN